MPEPSLLYFRISTYTLAYTTCALILAGCASLRQSSEDVTPFSFALIGDMPYAPEDSMRFERLMAEINADRSLEWVMHAGDIKTGASSCSDEYLRGRRDWLSRFEHPFILTPGDNEWTDCHQITAGEYAPLERLSQLRELFYPEPTRTFGSRPFSVETQATEAAFEEYVENVLWERGGVIFGTMHIVGSRNGRFPFASRKEADDLGAQRRMDAAIAWLEHIFERASESDSRAVFILMHANPGFETYARGAADSAYLPLLQALDSALGQFDRPIILAHGDSHYFRIDKPFANAVTRKRWIHFTRVETFGAGDVHWLRITVNPADENVFSIRQEIVMGR